MVVHLFNNSSCEVEAGEFKASLMYIHNEFQANQRYVVRPCLNRGGGRESGFSSSVLSPMRHLNWSCSLVLCLCTARSSVRCHSVNHFILLLFIIILNLHFPSQGRTFCSATGKSKLLVATSECQSFSFRPFPSLRVVLSEWRDTEQYHYLSTSRILLCTSGLETMRFIIEN